MIIVLTILHVLVCMFLIIVVLLQSGKAADLAGAFGGMSQATFGPRGTATLLSKLTTASAVLFMVTSLSLSILATRESGTGGSVTDRLKPKEAKKAETGGQPKKNTIKVKGSDGKETEIPLPDDLKQLPAPPPSK